jgi:hypothetical protein
MTSEAEASQVRTSVGAYQLPRNTTVELERLAPMPTFSRPA